MESHAASVATETATPALLADAGLTNADASARLARDGYNELPTAKPRRLFAIAADVAREPMFLLLMACGAIYLLLGDKGEAAMLLAFVFVIIAITFVQERKSERALEALRDLSSPRALVIREGEQMRIAGRDVVVGDLLVLAEGDRVAADAMVCRATNLAVDESLLTGESVPVAKIAATEPAERMGAPGGDATPFVFSGSLVVQGKGMARVLAIGNQTALGRIGSALAAVRPEPTRIQRETARLVRRIAWCGAGLSVLITIVYGLTRGEWLNAFLTGITFAMAILPEELPVILTIFLGLGAWRIAKNRVLTRHMPALEMLGSATVLCVDKTGTLTQNRMTLAGLHSSGQELDVAATPDSALAGAFPRAPRVCDAREPTRSVRPDGQGDQGRHRTAPRRYRARSSGLDARRRVSAVAGASGHFAGMALARSGATT